VAATLDLPLAETGATRPPPEARRQGAIPELDGLRGIAILLVLLRHGARPYWEGTGSLYPIGAWDAGIPLVNGWMGVDLFFVLSGFLIAHHIMRRSEGPVARIAWGEYCSRRLLRIVPAYYAVLLLVALVPLGFYPIDRDGIGLRLAYHLLFLQDYLPSDFVVAFWSLGVEVKFYLAAPLLLLAVTRLAEPSARYRALVLLLLAPLVLRVLTALQHPGPQTYEQFFVVFRSPLHLCMDALLVGVLCALLHRDRDLLRWTHRPGVVSLLFWLGAALVGWLLAADPRLDRIDRFDQTLMPSLLALGMGAVLLGASLGGGPGKLLRLPPLAFLARVSYSLYLVHLIFVPVVKVGVHELLSARSPSPGVEFAVFFPVFSLVSIAFAILLYRAVERPFMRMRRRPTLTA
jgi:peptidoglycan/LPS O-acetylase OafA/YrhL